MVRWPEFKAQYITTFLANWCAVNYADACMLSQHERLENPPCEDAAFLAEKAWEKLRDTGVLKPIPYVDRKLWPNSHCL